MARHTGASTPTELVTGNAGDQPGACPVLDGAPTHSELPTDQGTGEATGLIYVDVTDEQVKVTSPDGSGGVATVSVADPSASVTLGSGDSTGLL